MWRTNIQNRYLTLIFMIVICLKYASGESEENKSENSTSHEEDKKDESSEEAEEHPPEELPSRVLERHKNYEIREIPVSKWICTKGEIVLTNDPFDGWQKRFDNDPFEVMAMPEWKKREDVAMFLTLLSYIQGVNDDHANIAMTVPVTMRVEPIDNGERAKLEICFWSGTEWSKKKLPKPKSKLVYLQAMRPVKVYVRKFGGWALSWSDWDREREALIKDLIKDGVKFGGIGSIEDKSSSSQSEEDSKRKKGRAESGAYFSVGYQSPFQKKNRRNEIWIVKQE